MKHPSWVPHWLPLPLEGTTPPASPPLEGAAPPASPPPSGPPLRALTEVKAALARGPEAPGTDEGTGSLKETPSSAHHRYLRPVRAFPPGGPLPVLRAEASPRPIRVPARARTGGAGRLAAACQRRGAARACCGAHSDPETTCLPSPSPPVKMALSRVCWSRAALWGSAVAPGPFVTRRLQLGRSGPAWRAPR